MQDGTTNVNGGDETMDTISTGPGPVAWKLAPSPESHVR